MAIANAPGGLKLHYAVHDFTDPWRDAPWVLLQHGFGRHGGFWYKWVPYLARYFRVIVPDMRGFGQSRDGFVLGDGFVLDDLSADIPRILDAAGIDKVHYVGEAFGGTLGIQAAAQHKERFASLTLLSAPVFLHKKVQDVFALKDGSWRQAILNQGIEKWAQGTNTVSRFPPWMPKGFLDWYSAELATGDAETLAAFSDLCSAYDQSRFLPEITAPVLGIYSLSREEQVDLLKAHVKRLTVRHIETDSYMFYQVFPRACSDLVRDFVGGIADIPVSEA